MSVHEAMAKAMVAVSAIQKTSSTSVSYKFRSIDDVMNALHGPLADNGLFLSVRVLDDWQLNPIPGSPDNQGRPRTQFQASFRVEIEVFHSSGESVTLGPGLAQSHDYGDKAVYQAQQNAIKYLLLTAFAIPTEDQDMDARTPDDVPAEIPVDAAPWLAEQVEERFALWTPEQQKKAGVSAAKIVKPMKPMTQQEADEMLYVMEADYVLEFPRPTDQLPLEGETKK